MFREEKGIVVKPDVLSENTFCFNVQFLASWETVVLEEWTNDPKKPHLIMVVQSTSV